MGNPEQQRHDRAITDLRQQPHAPLPLAPALPSLLTPSEGLTTGGGYASPAPGEPATQFARANSTAGPLPSAGDLHAAITSAPPASPIRR